MTLNITLIMPGYILQASDRRMVSLATGEVSDDERNKAVVLKTVDGVFAITFAGVGAYKDKSGAVKPIDFWLTETLAENGGPEVPIEDAVAIIERESTNFFRPFAKDETTRHTFVVAGWSWRQDTPVPTLWAVSNCRDADNRMRPKAATKFETRSYRLTEKKAEVVAFGLHQALVRSDRRRLEAAIKRGLSIERGEDLLVETIRAAASRPKGSWGINSNVLTVAIDREGRTRAISHRKDGPSTGYEPLLLYHRDGWTIMQGGGEFTQGAAASLGDNALAIQGSDDVKPPSFIEIETVFRQWPGKLNKPTSSVGRGFPILTTGRVLPAAFSPKQPSGKVQQS